MTNASNTICSNTQQHEFSVIDSSMVRIIVVFYELLPPHNIRISTVTVPVHMHGK